MSNETKWSKEPWRACKEGECSCGQIWSVPCDAPIVTVTTGKWGDSYPKIVLQGGDLDQTAKAVMDMIEYGEIPKEMSQANAARIVACVNFLSAHPDLSVVEVVGNEEIACLRRVEALEHQRVADNHALIESNTVLRATNEKLLETLKEVTPYAQELSELYGARLLSETATEIRAQVATANALIASAGGAQ